jgi:mRNA interferase HigB
VIVIAPRKLREHWDTPGRGDSEAPLKAWLELAERADWRSPVDVKAQYGHASIVGNDRVLFNIAGNKYRIVVLIHYNKRTLYIRFVGTHAEYDSIDATIV